MTFKWCYHHTDMRSHTETGDIVSAISKTT